MHMFTSNPHLHAEFARERHHDLMRQAQEWRLIEEVRATQRRERGPSRLTLLWNRLVVALSTPRRQDVEPSEQMAPC